MANRWQIDYLIVLDEESSHVMARRLMRWVEWRCLAVGVVVKSKLPNQLVGEINKVITNFAVNVTSGCDVRIGNQSVLLKRIRTNFKFESMKLRSFGRQLNSQCQIFVYFGLKGTRADRSYYITTFI